ncbi:MAG: HAD family hydrolase [Acidobacteriota bacterium]
MEGVTAIVFDWDGTLMDSYASGFQASMAVFQHFGIPADGDRFLTTYNPNWYETYRTVGLPEEDWEKADRLWLEHYHRNPPRLYPFARRTLEALCKHGYELALVTSGTRDRVIGELAGYDLKRFFSATVCFEDTRDKKPHPAPLRKALERMKRAPATSVYVGDRPEDILMGRRTGTFTIGVESNYVTRTLLEKAAPDLILRHAGQLLARFGPAPNEHDPP